MKKMILNADEIKEINKRIGSELSNKFSSSTLAPIFIGVMKGALPFMMDLIREVSIDIELDFIQVSSYRGTETTGTIIMKRDVSCNITNRDIVLIEDIVDTGFTMNYVVKYLQDKYKPASITTVSLLDKKCKRKMPFTVDFTGKDIEDEFVVGYGLDYKEILRNKKDIFVPTEEEILELDRKAID